MDDKKSQQFTALQNLSREKGCQVTLFRAATRIRVWPGALTFSSTGAVRTYLNGLPDKHQQGELI